MKTMQTKPTLKGYVLLTEQLERANRELTRLNMLKDRLLSIVSHDVRAPLNSLKSFLSILTNENLSPVEHDHLVLDLENQLIQVDHFLDNLLQWIKNNSDQIEPELRNLSLCTLVNETIDLLAQIAHRKQINIRAEVPGEITVYADEQIIKLVLRNLVSNAIKFSRAGDQIIIYVEQEADLVRVFVNDTGRGISSENLLNLFNCSRLNTTGTSREIGAGLGLSLCKEFIEKTGGEIFAKSTEGKGSCFEFTVPSGNMMIFDNQSPNEFNARK